MRSFMGPMMERSLTSDDGCLGGWHHGSILGTRLFGLDGANVGYPRHGGNITDWN
jgi:hypothetical protein